MGCQLALHQGYGRYYVSAGVLSTWSTALKENISIPIYVHTHATTGLGYMTYLKAAEAGADRH